MLNGFSINNLDRLRLPLLEFLTEPKISPRELGAGDGRWWLQLLLAPIHHLRGHKAEYQSHLPAFNCAKFQVTIESYNLKVSKVKSKFCNALGLSISGVWGVTLSSDTYRRTIYHWGASSTYFWFEDEEEYGMCVVFMDPISLHTASLLLRYNIDRDWSLRDKWLTETFVIWDVIQVNWSSCVIWWWLKAGVQRSL